jgi:hypothetical protein
MSETVSVRADEKLTASSAPTHGAAATRGSAGHGTLLETLAVGHCRVLPFERRQERNVERRSKLYSWRSRS